MYHHFHLQFTLISSMAFQYRLSVLVFFALAVVQLSSCQVLQGKVSCHDCNLHYDLSGIKVAVKCDKVKKLTMASTVSGGYFTVDLPLSDSPPEKCLAKLLGGPNQIYSTKQNMVSEVVKTRKSSPAAYTTSSPLVFSTSCAPAAKCGAPNTFGASKTVDLPIPKEWGLPPTSYYTPFFPIIGIP